MNDLYEAVFQERTIGYIPQMLLLVLLENLLVDLSD